MLDVSSGYSKIYFPFLLMIIPSCITKLESNHFDYIHFLPLLTIHEHELALGLVAFDITIYCAQLVLQFSHKVAYELSSDQKVFVSL